MHSQIFGENLMTRGFWNSIFLSYFMNGQTTIGLNHFPDFLDVFVVFWCWLLPWTFIVYSWILALFLPLVVCVLIMASSPNACFNILKVSKNVFPNLKQNFTLAHCSWKSPVLICWKIHWASKICIHSIRHSTMTKLSRMIQFLSFA